MTGQSSSCQTSSPPLTRQRRVRRPSVIPEHTTWPLRSAVADKGQRWPRVTAVTQTTTSCRCESLTQEIPPSLTAATSSRTSESGSLFALLDSNSVFYILVSTWRNKRTIHYLWESKEYIKDKWRYCVNITLVRVMDWWWVTGFNILMIVDEIHLF